MMNQYGHEIKQIAIEMAALCERDIGRPCYVVRDVTDPVGHCWAVTDKMPLLGEWYSADGIRHG